MLSISLLLWGIVFAATQTPAPVQSGLTVVAESARAQIKPGEPLVLRLSFQNTSNQAFRLPDGIEPATFNYWSLNLQDVTTGKSYTGISTKPMGAAAEPGEINPQLMQPGEKKTISVAFERFAFVEGDMDFQNARNVWFPQRQNGSFPLPIGTYRISVRIRFRTFLNRPNLPKEIDEARRSIESDPIPLWKGSDIESCSTQILVNTAAATQEKETVQIAKDNAGSVLDLLEILKHDAGFASLLNHAGLRNDLRVVESAALAVMNSDGKDAIALKSQVGDLSKALTQASTRSLEIFRRTNEAQDDRNKARGLAMRLQGFGPF